MPVDSIEVRSNLELTMRERGKIVDRRIGHNIWLDIGREYLSKLISFVDYTPTYFENNRIRYMGLGIGGTRQIALPVANTPPLSVSYPGPNTQTDTDPTLTDLERPVRISGGSSSPPYVVSDVWLGQIAAPPTFPTGTSVKFTRLFTAVEVSYAPYVTVPLSEVMLYTSGANVNSYTNTGFGVAYDTFDTISKTNAFELQIDWTVRF